MLILQNWCFDIRPDHAWWFYTNPMFNDTLSSYKCRFFFFAFTLCNFWFLVCDLIKHFIFIITWLIIFRFHGYFWKLNWDPNVFLVKIYFYFHKQYSKQDKSKLFIIRWACLINNIWNSFFHKIIENIDLQQFD